MKLNTPRIRKIYPKRCASSFDKENRYTPRYTPRPGIDSVLKSRDAYETLLKSAKLRQRFDPIRSSLPEYNKLYVRK